MFFIRMYCLFFFFIALITNISSSHGDSLYLTEQSGWTRPWKSTTFSLRNNDSAKDIQFSLKRFTSDFHFSTLLIKNSEKKVIQIASQEKTKQKNIYLFEKNDSGRFTLIAALKKMQAESDGIDHWMIRDDKKQVLAKDLMRLQIDEQDIVYQYQDTTGQPHTLATLSPYPDSYGSWFFEDDDYRLQHLLAALLTFQRDERYGQIRNQWILFSLAIGAAGFLGWQYWGRQNWENYQNHQNIASQRQTRVNEHKEGFLKRHPDLANTPTQPLSIPLPAQHTASTTPSHPSTVRSPMTIGTAPSTSRQNGAEPKGVFGFFQRRTGS